MSGKNGKSRRRLSAAEKFKILEEARAGSTLGSLRIIRNQTGRWSGITFPAREHAGPPDG